MHTLCKKLLWPTERGKGKCRTFQMPKFQNATSRSCIRNQFKENLDGNRNQYGTIFGACSQQLFEITNGINHLYTNIKYLFTNSASRKIERHMKCTSRE